MTDPIFEKWFDGIIKKWEGGIANRPPEEDPGGYTNHGVTIGTWKNGGAKLLARPATVAALSQITWDDAKKIAYHMYWLANKVNQVKNPAFRPIVMDSFWLGGGMKSLGYNSVAGLNAALNETVDKLYKKRLLFLQKLSNWNTNKGGWTSRLNDIKAMGSKIATRRNLLIGGGVMAFVASGIIAYKYFQK